MQRRDFLGGIVGSAVAWSHAAHAQRPRLPTIGILIPAGLEAFWNGFQQGLLEHGYIEGQTIHVEFRSAEGKSDLLRGMADELVQLKVDVIVASQTPAVIAARQATTKIPIVMAPAGAPVETGLISSLAQPGGNITGLSGSTAALGAKTLELIREVLPAARRVAILTNATDPFSRPFSELIEDSGRAAGFAIQTIKVQRVEEFESAFAAMDKERAEAVIVQPSLPRGPTLDMALKHHLPAVGTSPLLAQEGGLMSYSGVQDEIFRRSAFYVDRILMGMKPADLPVEQPTRYELVVNLKTAKALGISIPTTVLARADEVIE